jgi:hypothetical protein
MHSPAPMKLIRSYPVRLFITTVVFSACSGNDEIAWKDSGNNDGIYISISENGKEGTGKTDIQFAGRLVRDRLVKGWPSNIPVTLDSMFKKKIASQMILKQLGKGASGYAKLDMEAYFMNVFAKLRHYSLYYAGDPGVKDLWKDSVRLAEMNVFDKIELLPEDKSSEDLGKQDPDLEWQALLQNNPLPSSIDLTLKKQLFLDNKFDSVRDLLKERFPKAELSFYTDEGFQDIMYGRTRVFVYKFKVN